MRGSEEKERENMERQILSDKLFKLLHRNLTSQIDNTTLKLNFNAQNKKTN